MKTKLVGLLLLILAWSGQVMADTSLIRHYDFQSATLGLQTHGQSVGGPTGPGATAVDSGSPLNRVVDSPFILGHDQVRGYHFAGNNNNYINTSLTVMDLLQGATFSTWFRYEGEHTGTYRPLFGGIEGPSRSLFFMGKEAGTSNFLFEGYHFSSGAFVARLDNAWDGNWHHFAATWNGNEWRFYLNGHLFFIQEKLAVAPNQIDTTIGIGIEDNLALHSWLGMMDDVRIHDRPLSADEIQSHYLHRIQQVHCDHVIDSGLCVSNNGRVLLDFEQGMSSHSQKMLFQAGNNRLVMTAGDTPFDQNPFYLIKHGTPERLYAPLDRVPAGRTGSYMLTDNIPGIRRNTYNYYLRFDQPVHDLALDLYDFRNDNGGLSGDVATLIAFSDDFQTVIDSTSFTVIPGLSDPDVVHFDLQGASGIKTAAVMFNANGAGDSGIGLDNIHFSNQLITEASNNASCQSGSDEYTVDISRNGQFDHGLLFSSNEFTNAYCDSLPIKAGEIAVVNVASQCRPGFQAMPIAGDYLLVVEQNGAAGERTFWKQEYQVPADGNAEYSLSFSLRNLTGAIPGPEVNIWLDTSKGDRILLDSINSLAGQGQWQAFDLEFTLESDVDNFSITFNSANGEGELGVDAIRLERRAFCSADGVDSGSGSESDDGDDSGDQGSDDETADDESSDETGTDDESSDSEDGSDDDNGDSGSGSDEDQNADTDNGSSDGNDDEAEEENGDQDSGADENDSESGSGSDSDGNNNSDSDAGSDTGIDSSDDTGSDSESDTDTGENNGNVNGDGSGSGSSINDGSGSNQQDSDNGSVKTGTDTFSGGSLGLGALLFMISVFRRNPLPARRIIRCLILKGISILALLLSSSAVAQTDFYNGLYLGVGPGVSSLKPDTDNTGYRLDDGVSAGGKLFTGYQWNHWRGELGYTILGEAELSVVGTENTGNIDYAAGYLEGQYRFWSNPSTGVTLYFSSGLSSVQASEDGIQTKDDGAIQLKLGAGAEFWFMPRLGVRLSVDRYSGDTSLFSLGLIGNFGRTPRQPIAGEPVIKVTPIEPVSALVFEEPVPVPEPEPEVVVHQKCPDGSRIIDNGENTCPEGKPQPEVTEERCELTHPGLPVDENGCSIFNRNYSDITFDVNSANLTLEAQILLDELANQLHLVSHFKVEVQAHTDSQGSSTYNLWLSNRRAEAIVDYLVDRGLSRTRLVARGYGETLPIADNATPEGRRMNRRAAFRILE